MRLLIQGGSRNGQWGEVEFGDFQEGKTLDDVKFLELNFKGINVVFPVTKIENDIIYLNGVEEQVQPTN